LKRTAVDTYRRQARGGKGRIGMGTRTEDFVEHLIVALDARIPADIHGQGPRVLAQNLRDTRRTTVGKGKHGAFGSACFNYDMWLRKIKSAFDPNNTADPTAYSPPE
jgi:hypothetical protein